MRTGTRFVRPPTKASRGIGGHVRHRTWRCTKRSVNKKARPLRPLRALKNAQESWEDYHDPSSEHLIESRASVRQAVWEAYMKSPTANSRDGRSPQAKTTLVSSGSGSPSASRLHASSPLPLISFPAISLITTSYVLTNSRRLQTDFFDVIHRR